MIVLMLGSGPSVVRSRAWPRAPFERIVAINNAWAVRDDWDILVHPEDFPEDRRPSRLGPAQRVVTAAEYVPANNAHGGIVYAGGTMAFSAGYWVLEALRPTVLAYLGCDMVYGTGPTHFYGAGTADPLRPDPTLQDLRAKAARLELLAARAGCAVVNLSATATRLTFARAEVASLPTLRPGPVAEAAVGRALAAEAALGAFVPSGRYWQSTALDAAALARIDALWLAALAQSRCSRHDVCRRSRARVRAIG